VFFFDVTPRRKQEIPGMLFFTAVKKKKKAVKKNLTAGEKTVILHNINALMESVLCGCRAEKGRMVRALGENKRLLTPEQTF